jgi:putative tryptophan/tyrosine transport system substrate-binding protein
MTVPDVPYLREAERAATALGFDLRAFEVRGPDDLPGAFVAMVDWRADGLVTLADGMLFSQRDRVVELALKGKLPGVYPEAEFVVAGGLASYGPSLPDLFSSSGIRSDSPFFRHQNSALNGFGETIARWRLRFS